MTPQEVAAFAARVANDERCAGNKRVLIKREDGLYLTRDGIRADISWTDNRNLANVYRYDDDNVGAQLQAVEMQYGHRWEAEVWEG